MYIFALQISSLSLRKVSLQLLDLWLAMSMLSDFGLFIADHKFGYFLPTSTIFPLCRYNAKDYRHFKVKIVTICLEKFKMLCFERISSKDHWFEAPSTWIWCYYLKKAEKLMNWRFRISLLHQFFCMNFCRKEKYASGGEKSQQNTRSNQSK